MKFVIITSLVSLVMGCSCSGEKESIVNKSSESLIIDQVVVNNTNANEADGTKPSEQNETLNKVNHCPSDMVEIEGDWCPSVLAECLRWVGTEGQPLPPPKSNQTGRCGEFKYPTKCLSKTRIHKHFCIDRLEWPNKPGELPQDWMSYWSAKKAIEAAGKRLCTGSEWDLAAEGNDMRPIPYGNGYKRDKTICNFDNSTKDFNVFKATSPDSPMAIKLHSLLIPGNLNSNCRSSMGVINMAGNIDEIVVNESGKPYKMELRGVWGKEQFKG